MKRSINALSAGLLVMCLQAPVWASSIGTAVFRDDFTGPNGSLPNATDWVISHPESWWWTEGRSFFPSPVYHPNAPLPHIQDGALIIEHHRYNPYHEEPPNTTFLGGEVHTTMTLGTEAGYMIEARVRWPDAPPGLVVSFFTYGYDPVREVSDEIDFEFLSNSVFDEPSTVWTNTWNDSHNGSNQSPETIQVTGFDLTDWQTLRIYWRPGERVDWIRVDQSGSEHHLRSETDTTYIPNEPMSVYFNFWAAKAIWSEAYDASFQPDQEDLGVIHRYEIDYVEIRIIPITGDLNCDGFVGITDLNIVLGNWNQTVPPGDPLADPSGDGFVGIADLNVVLGNWNAGTPPSNNTNIPEPASLACLGLVALSLMRRSPLMALDLFRRVR